MPRWRWVRRASWTVAALLAGAMAVRSASDPGPGTAVAGALALHPAPAAPGFRLTDQFGRGVSLSSLRGKTIVLAFVDSRCTTVCPLTAQEMRLAQQRLGPAGARVQLLAVNANPTATSVAAVRSWSQAHGMQQHWLFLTGTPTQLAAVWRAYHIYVAVVRGLIDHTPAVYVIGPRGHERFVSQTSGDFAAVGAGARALAAEAAAVLPQPWRLVGGVWSRTAAILDQLHVLAEGAVRPHTVAIRVVPGLSPSGRSATVRVGGASGSDQLVAFFATWCVACREDMRVLRAYRQRAAALHLPPAVAVDLRVAEPSTAWVRRFVSVHRLGLPVALDRHGRIASAYGVAALPFLALVGSHGTVRWQHVGVLTLASLESQVRAAGT